MYNLDPNEARKADQGGSRISEIGKYVGTFTQAEDITAGTGTKGVALRFECNGQTANLSLYTTKTDGTKIMGFQALMAIMTCMSLRGITPKPGTVKHWDNEAKAEVTRPGQVFPELCGKPIGLLLETEDYPKNSGGTGTRMVIAGIFQASTELTASEILDKKTQPEQLAKLIGHLKHRPICGAKPAAARPAQWKRTLRRSTPATRPAARNASKRPCARIGWRRSTITANTIRCAPASRIA